MRRTGINEELLKKVLSPPPWVDNLQPDPDGKHPYFLKSLREPVTDFLEATTDSVRLVRASHASRAILREYDLSELEDLRSNIQVSELLRVIPYALQTDHSAHTLYLFLLGIYLFFYCSPIREGLAQFLKEPDKSAKLLTRFLFQWVFASLLHDIGYIFQGRSKSEIRAVDRLFRATTVTRLMGQAPLNLKRKVAETIKKTSIRPLEPLHNPEDILTALADMSWGRLADLRDDAFESFSIYGPKKQQVDASAIEEYAFLVASNGYDGHSEGTVDHAVASGLFLLRYSTFWYFLAKDSGFEGEFSRYQDGGYPKEDVVQACFATAAHNLIQAYGEKYGRLSFDSNPLMYLGVLCDELQKWDRFPSGERHLVDLQSFENYCTDSERVALKGEDNGGPIYLEICPSKLAESVAHSLTKRLDGPEKYVSVKPP
jgi:hypothetical protein